MTHFKGKLNLLLKSAFSKLNDLNFGEALSKCKYEFRGEFRLENMKHFFASLEADCHDIRGDIFFIFLRKKILALKPIVITRQIRSFAKKYLHKRIFCIS